MEWKRLSTFLLVSYCVILLLAACNSGGGSSSTPVTDAPIFSSTTAIIDDQGGMVTDNGGASVSIPAGILTEQMSVTVGTLDKATGLPPTGDPLSFSGGISLEPHGTVFSNPVSISIPLAQPQSPGRQLRLYYWNQVSKAWEETDFFMTVSMDGTSAHGKVTHFSYFILQPNQIESEIDGIFGDIEGAVSQATLAGGDLKAAIQAVDSEVNAHVNGRFSLGKPVAMDIIAQNGYNCYQPVGMYFEFYHNGEPELPNPLVVTIGDIDNVEFRIDYLREIDVTVKAAGIENNVVGQYTVNVYWRSTPPILTLSSDASKLWGGDDTTVSASLMCDDDAMEGQLINFSVPSGSRNGSLNYDGIQTDSSGKANVVFTALPEAQGIVTIQADYNWSNVNRSVQLKLSDSVDLTSGTLTGTWAITGKESVSGCQNPLDNGSFSGGGAVYLEQLDDTFTGMANYPWVSDAITGTVTRTENGGYTFEGSADYIEEEVDCTSGTCITLTTQGIAHFNGAGSIGTQAFDLIWVGNDTVGDTCAFNGDGKATYVGPAIPPDPNPGNPPAGGIILPQGWTGTATYQYSDWSKAFNTVTLTPPQNVWSEQHEITIDVDPATGSLIGEDIIIFNFPILESYNLIDIGCNFEARHDMTLYAVPDTGTIRLFFSGTQSSSDLQFSLDSVIVDPLSTPVSIGTILGSTDYQTKCDPGGNNCVCINNGYVESSYSDTFTPSVLTGHSLTLEAVLNSFEDFVLVWKNGVISDSIMAADYRDYSTGIPFNNMEATWSVIKTDVDPGL